MSAPVPTFEPGQRVLVSGDYSFNAVVVEPEHYFSCDEHGHRTIAVIAEGDDDNEVYYFCPTVLELAK